MKRSISLIASLFILNAFVGVSLGERPATAAPTSPPLRIVILQDVSGSAKGIPRLSSADLDRLITYIAANGGELAFTTIGETVPPLTRLVLRPPPRPAFEVTEKNILRAARQRAAIEEQRAAYRAQLAQFQAASEPRIQAFKKAVAAMLSQRANETRLHDALVRAVLFLQEPSSFPGAAQFLVVISDGKDTSRQAAPLALPTAHLFVVAASTDLGVLDQWRDRVTLFESPAAVISYVIGGAACTP